MDPLDPYPPDSMGHTFCILFICLATEWMYGQLTKDIGEGVYQAVHNLLYINKGFGNQIQGFRVDAGSTGQSLEFKATIGGFRSFVNACDKERQNRNPVERQVPPVVTLAAIQLAEASTTVSFRQWGVAMLHAICILDIFPNARSRSFGDGELSPLEAFSHCIKPDVSNWFRFGTLGTFNVLGKHPPFTSKGSIGA